jgi:ATPases of the AAA+ class
MGRLKDSVDKLCSAVCAELPPLTAGLDRIYRKVSSEGYSDESAAALKQDIKAVSERFGISSKAAVLLAAILEKSCRNGCDEEDMASYVGCSYIEFIGFLSALREMEDRSVICCRSGRRNCFVVSREAFKTIEKDTDFVPLKRSGLTADELFSRFRLCYSEFGRGDIDCERLLEELEQLISDNQQLEFCAKTSEALSNPNFCDSEKRFFLTLCNRYVSHGDKSVPIERLVQLTDYLEDEQRVRRSLASGRSDLQRSGLVTFGGEEGFQDTDSLALSEEVRRTFFTGVSPAREPSVKCRDLIPCSAIKPRELFFDGKVREQMDRLAGLLDPVNFAGVQERLCQMGMRKGFAVLFSGGAGCGKTAGAYELARRTGRDIYAVDMSELKSKWVGDSEKIVKGVFTTYRQMCRTSERSPILLFNEADAIFSKRMQNPQDSVDQMMNSIQNICLDAIENLEGILIATTNLASNFCDDAFARRFIFKVEFTKPVAGTRAKIWMSMIGGLSEEDAITLASRYDFSGGNIENIARKAAVGYVLGGTAAGLKELTGYCEEETLPSQRTGRRIGFQS